MDEIIIRSLQGILSAGEEEALQQWRQESLQNERYYRDMARAWNYATLIPPGSGSATGHTPGEQRSTPWPGRQRRRFGRSRVAAAVLSAAAILALGVGIGVVYRPDPPVRLGAEEFVTGRREMVTVRLTDGTMVRLAPDSRLRVAWEGRPREVWLDGRGFFAVANDSAHAFVVRTRAGDAVVLGTRFDVNVDQDGMQVFVLEGRVAHQAGGQQVEVGAMQLSRVSGGGTPEVEPLDDAKPLLSWLGEFLVFQATPMTSVARELERRYGVTVRVADARVGARTVTAWFGDETLDQVLLIVCRAADVHCSVRDDVVSIEP